MAYFELLKNLLKIPVKNVLFNETVNGVGVIGVLIAKNYSLYIITTRPNPMKNQSNNLINR